MDINSLSQTRTLERKLLDVLPRLVPSLTVTPRSVTDQGSLRLAVRTPRGRTHRVSLATRVASSPSRMLHVLEQLKTAKAKERLRYPVFGSTFLSARARQLCREAGVGYLDLAGNCYLEFDDWVFQKVVEDNPFPHRGRPASLFAPISSRIVRALLEEPKRRWRISELATVAGVSLGQTSNVCRRLIDEAYAKTAHRAFALTRPEELLTAWQQVYAMRQHTHTAAYSFERDPERLLRRIAAVAAQRRWRYAVTSFAAASLVAPFVHGVGTVQWYVGEDASVQEWMQALNLRPVEAGPNVVLLEPRDAGVFYRAQQVRGVTLVGTIQLYLDVAADPARGREQAEFLRNARLGF